MYRDYEDENEEKLGFWSSIKDILIMLLVAVVWFFLMIIIFPTPVVEGVVTEKQFTAAYDEDITSQYTSETDKYEIYRHYPNVWQISVYGDDWLGRKRTEVYYVLRDRYNSLEIGDSWKWIGGLDYQVPPESWDDPIPDELSHHGGNGYHVIIPHPL